MTGFKEELAGRIFLPDTFFLGGKVLTYSCLTRATVKVKVEGLSHKLN
jgi:hypothetical protein